MLNWKFIAIPLLIVGVIAAALALTPLGMERTIQAAPPAQAPTTEPINAIVTIVPVAANETGDPNVITGTIEMVTDTAVGAVDTVIAMGASGLNNVPLNVPVTLECMPDDVTFTGPITPTWSLYKPPQSTAEFSDPKANLTKFTPDLAGAYAVACTLPGGGQAGGVHLYAGAYIGNNAETCATCHPNQVQDWLGTGHGNSLKSLIDNSKTPDQETHFNEQCAACHVTGYFVPPVGAGNGGFKDAAIETGWTFPTFEEINEAGKSGTSNWDAMPDQVKAMANVGCEACHGPAADHVNNNAPIMASSQQEGTCNVCHNSSNRNDKGEQLANAGHSDVNSPAFNEPIGPTRQLCVRCHSGEGFSSFIENPTNPAAWTNTKQTIVCATCHDPHSADNPAQLRIVGTPIEMPFEITKDVGLSAACFECHNSRTDPADAIKSSFPHYSSVAEFLSNTGGVDYGQKVSNSPHGDLVGVSADDNGNIPGPCVACHMAPIITDPEDPNFEKVGGHSFNTVSPDRTFEYTAACTTCHQDLTTFNMPAKADYDGNGKTEGVQDEVLGLLNVVWAELEAAGVKKVDTGYPYAVLPRVDGQVDDKIDNAWYNYRTVYGVMWGEETGDGNQGKAQAMHNFKRAVMLLQLSYKDLTGKDVPGATLMK